MSVRILLGDVRDQLKTLADESVHCVVTSPPYFGLRDYGTASWEGGDAACDHKQGRPGAGRADGVVDDRAQRNRDGVGSMGGDCKRCGAIRTDKQIGLEPTPAEFVETMVAVFREVRRVLRADGTLWLNLGDSYSNAGTRQGDRDGGVGDATNDHRKVGSGYIARIPGLKNKDLIGIPWRVAFALQADGWYLRQDIIWSKPNPMPESVTDRCTKAHEYLFLLTKSARYHYDAAAIAEPVADATVSRLAQDVECQEGSHRVAGKTNGTMKAVRKRADRFGGNKHGGDTTKHSDGSVYTGRETRNKRSVWEVCTQPYSEAHFATFPPALIEPCILAGCPKDCCAKCGAPVVRQIEKIGGSYAERKTAGVGGPYNMKPQEYQTCGTSTSITTGWSPSCSCDNGTTRGVCLDPFGGAGTTGLVADRHGRSAILIELNPEYAAIAERRIKNDAGMFAEVAA